ncbi:MAG: LptF/LptG family permease, partial [Pseudomonadota bacterium]
NLFVQPAAQREMRAQVQEARTELVSTLFRPGQFTSPDENLTVFARDHLGIELIGVQIAERAGQSDGRDYLAERGRFIEVDGIPSIVMFEGEIHQLDNNGALNVLKFDQSTFDLSPFMSERGAVILKASDRYLHELVFLDPNDYQDVQDRDKLIAEAHLRVTTPLLSIAMALIAILAVIGGSFSRLGYSQRIIWASVGSLILTILQLSVQSAARSDSIVNIAQWGVPLIAITILSYVIFWRGRRIKSASREAVTA